MKPPFEAGSRSSNRGQSAITSNKKQGGSRRRHWPQQWLQTNKLRLNTNLVCPLNESNSYEWVNSAYQVCMNSVSNQLISPCFFLVYLIVRWKCNLSIYTRTAATPDAPMLLSFSRAAKSWGRLCVATALPRHQALRCCFQRHCRGARVHPSMKIKRNEVKWQEGRFGSRFWIPETVDGETAEARGRLGRTPLRRGEASPKSTEGRFL